MVKNLLCGLNKSTLVIPQPANPLSVHVLPTAYAPGAVIGDTMNKVPSKVKRAALASAEELCELCGFIPCFT